MEEVETKARRSKGERNEGATTRRASSSSSSSSSHLDHMEHTHTGFVCRGVSFVTVGAAFTTKRVKSVEHTLREQQVVVVYLDGAKQSTAQATPAARLKRHSRTRIKGKQRRKEEKGSGDGRSRTAPHHPQREKGERASERARHATCRRLHPVTCHRFIYFSSRSRKGREKKRRGVD